MGYMLGTGRVVIARDVLWMNVFFNNETRIDINSEGIDMEGWIDEDSDPEYNSKAKKKVTFNITKDKQSKTHKGSTSNNEIEPQQTTRAIDNSGENVTLEEIKATRERIQKAIKKEQKVKNALKKLDTSYNPHIENKKLKRELKRLETDLNLNPKKNEEDTKISMEDELINMMLEED